MKISLIAVKPKHSAYGLFSIVPLGPLYLGTLMKNRGHRVTVYDEARANIFNEKIGWIHPNVLGSDFIGLSVISPAANRALHILDAIRAQKPGIRTAVGGPHVLGMEQAEEFSSHADVVVQKEAENIIEEVVNGKLTGILEGSTVEDLDSLPVPDMNLVEVTRRKILDFFKLTPISTSRGCPRACEFCSVSNIHGKKVRRRSPESVLQEFRQRLHEGYKRIFFVDDNFSVQPSKRIPLLEALIEEKEKGAWFESMV